MGKKLKIISVKYQEWDKDVYSLLSNLAKRAERHERDTNGRERC